MIWNILKKEKRTVELPYRFDMNTIFPFISSIIDENYDCKCNSLVFDFHNLSFIEPIAITVLSNLIEYLKLLKVKVEFLNLNLRKQPIKYLDDCGFFKQYLGKPLTDQSTLRQTTLPLELVEYAKSYEYMGYRLVPWLSRNLEVDERSLSTLKVCFQEIYNNIKDHSTQSIGCSFAQHYPTKGIIQITVSDFGVGIPENVRKVHANLQDHLAIEKASEEGFTTQSTGRNRGAGLDVLIKNVVFKNRGVINILSRHGSLKCINVDGNIKKIPRQIEDFYPGTLIQLIIDTNKFVFDEIEEEFEWI